MRSVTAGITLLVGATLLVAAVAFKPAPAKAEIFYPWCMKVYLGDGGDNCSFDSFEQCRQSSLGNGGFCVQNIWYKQEPAPQPPPVAAPAAATPAAAPPPQKKKPAPAPKPNQ
jgi:hypothetical protein